MPSRRRRRSGRAARAAPRPTAEAQPVVRPRRGSPPARARRSGRRATGRRPPRRSDPTGSRSSPRGKIRPRPNGIKASSRTMSRSRAKRRCWKPSSRTSSSDSSSSTARSGEVDAVGALEVGDVGQVLVEDARLVVVAALPAVAPAQDRDPHPARRNHRATHSTIGVLPVPPSVRLPTDTTGTAARCVSFHPRSKARFRARTASPYPDAASPSPDREAAARGPGPRPGPTAGRRPHPPRPLPRPAILTLAFDVRKAPRGPVRARRRHAPRPRWRTSARCGTRGLPGRSR